MFGQKGALIYGMNCILHRVKCANLNLPQKQPICRENSRRALDKSFSGHFCPRRNAANFYHPALQKRLVDWYWLLLANDPKISKISSKIKPLQCNISLFLGCWNDKIKPLQCNISLFLGYWHDKVKPLHCNISLFLGCWNDKIKPLQCNISLLLGCWNDKIKPLQCNNSLFLGCWNDKIKPLQCKPADSGQSWHPRHCCNSMFKINKYVDLTKPNCAFYPCNVRTMLLFSRPMGDRDTSALRETFNIPHWSWSLSTYVR